MSVSDYATVHARVRVMVAGLLTPAILEELASAPDLGALVRTLKRTVYAPTLDGLDENALTPRRVVYQLKSRLGRDYASLIQAVPSQARKLLMQLYRRFEVDNLKAVLRGIASGSSWERVRFVLFPLGSFTLLPAQEMLEAGNIPAAVELLSRTPYYNTLTHAMERYNAEGSLFPLEVSLDLNNWRTLWEETNRLSGRDREQGMRIVGSLTDMTNLMWAVRYRVYHHLAEEEIINYTLPFGNQVRDEEIRAIAAGADISQSVKRIYPDLPDLQDALQDPQSGLPKLEILLQSRVADECRAAFLGYPFHIGIPLAYLILNELEIQDLTVLIEAKDARIPVEGFRAYLLAGTSTGEGLPA